MDTIDNLNERYGGSPVIRALVQLIPFGIGSALDVLLTERVVKMRQDIFEALMDNLVESEAVFTEEMISEESFLHNYFLTVKSVVSTKRREKIDFTSKLFINYAKGDMDEVHDEYEELLLILDELTLREIRIVMMLKEYELKYPMNEEENELQRANKFWDEFTDQLVNELDIHSDLIRPTVRRITRTGLCEIFTGYWDQTGDKIKTTPLLDQLLKRINSI